MWLLSVSLLSGLVLPMCGAFAAISFYTVGDGSWNNAVIWTNSAQSVSIPGSSDKTHVRHEISVTQAVTVSELNIQGGTLNIGSGITLITTGEATTSVWNNARLGGAGVFQNSSGMMISGTPSTVEGFFVNASELTFVHTPSFELNGSFYNSTGATVFTSSAPTNMITMQGVGSFYNAGDFTVGAGTTCNWEYARLHNQGGSVNLMTGSHFRVSSSGGTNWNYFCIIHTNAVYELNSCTNFFYGTTHLSGPGHVKMTNGVMRFIGAGSTNPAIDGAGGGFLWQGGMVQVIPPDDVLNNYGNITIGGQNGSTRLLQGALGNWGSITLDGSTGSFFNVSGAISNAPSGSFTFSGTNSLIVGFGGSFFHNSGAVSFYDSGTSSVDMAYFQHSGTTTFHRGSANLYGEMYNGLFWMNGGSWFGGQSFYMSGGNVGGSGLIANNIVQSSGTLSPGQSAGKLQIEGFYSQSAADAVLLMEIGGTEAGTAYDQVTVSSTGTVGGILTVELLDGYQPTADSKFELLVASQISGRFVETNLPALSGNVSWALSYLADGIQLSVDPDAPPSVPTGVTASDGTYEDKVRITWNAANDAASYEVWRNTVSNSATATKLEPSVTSNLFDDASAVVKTTYFYWVKAVNSLGTSDFSASDTGYRAEPVSSVPVYRFYSYGAQESTYTHLWTINETEKDVILTWPSWQYEGIAWYALTNMPEGAIPLYRLYEPNIRRHLYTVSATEYVALDSGSWNGEDVQYFVYPTNSVSGAIPAYRFYHNVNQNHHFTIDENEKDTIIATPEWGYTYEGIAFYVFASDEASSLKQVEMVDGTRLDELFQRKAVTYLPQADYTGDGLTDIVVYDENTGLWHILSEGKEFQISNIKYQIAPLAHWGGPGMVAVPGDYDGDGVYDLAVYEQDTGCWYIRSVAGEIILWGVQWGSVDMSVVSGNYDGDLAYDLAVYHGQSGEWFIRNIDGDILLWAEQWGGTGFIPFAFDYTGDGVSDLCVYCFKTGKWFIRSVDGAILFLPEGR